jgi:hypothetical protein
MATTARKFPVIKEVGTFLVEGVGSGGDYHNVSSIFHWIATPLTLSGRLTADTG